jgi:16S rRNA (guanine1207-N2)-methyltransferase
MERDHYFSAEPAAPDERRTLHVRLAGRDVDVQTSRGVFSPHRVDLGTSVLLRYVPDPPDAGHLLDLGCGWGPLALSMAMLAPSATVWAVDVNARALDLVRANAAALGLGGVRAVPPDGVPDDVALAALWSNPPIRVGKTELHAMLRRWLPRLRAGAAAHLVVQRNLGGDSLHAWLGAELGPEFQTVRAGSAKGFRVLRVTRHGPA